MRRRLETNIRSVEEISLRLRPFQNRLEEAKLFGQEIFQLLDIVDDALPLPSERILRRVVEVAAKSNELLR